MIKLQLRQDNRLRVYNQFMIVFNRVGHKIVIMRLDIEDLDTWTIKLDDMNNEGYQGLDLVISEYKFR